jgi:putative aldouronate transport system substrate-binding protein
MNKTVIIVPMLLAIAVASAMAAGTGEQETRATPRDVEAVSEDAWRFDAYDPPITLTIMHSSHQQDFAPGDESGDTAFDEWLLSELGINVEFAWNVASGQAEQKLNLALASGDMPDSGLVATDDIKRLAEEGAIIPLDTLYETHLSPLTQFLLDEHDEYLDGHLYDAVTVEGARYGIPQTSDPWGRMSHSNWIRKDILEEQGMEVPETLNEFEEVLRAYKRAYPDGYGINLSKAMLDSSRPGASGLSIAMEPFNAFPMRWVERDGKLVYGSIQPEVKQGLAVLQDWYQKGYIDPEFIVKDRRKELEAFAAGDVLAAHYEWFFVWNPGQQAIANVEGADLTVMPPLKGPSGNRQSMLTNPLQFAVFISTTCEHPEAYFHYINRLADSSYRDDRELRELMETQYGYEFRYAYAEEKLWEGDPDVPEPERTFDYPDDQQGPGGFFNTYVPGKAQYSSLGNISDKRPGEQLELFNRMMHVPEEEWNSSTAKIANNYRRRGILDAHLDNVRMFLEMDAKDVYDHALYYGGPTPTMVETGAYLQKIEEEAFAKIIMGEPLSLFDDFVENWMSGGGADITVEVNEWRAGLQ